MLHYPLHGDVSNIGHTTNGTIHNDGYGGSVSYFLALGRALGLHGAKVSWIYDELALLYGVVLPF